MTATMILKEIRALSVREKSQLFKRLERERETAEDLDAIRLFDQAKREVDGHKPTGLRQFLKQAKIKA